MKKTLKILSIVVACILILGLLYIANGFLGNPVSKFIVNKKANEYINNTYPDLSLNKEIFYSFKDSNYYVTLSSEESKDLVFVLSYSMSGKLNYDTYESNITNGYNVMERITGDYREEAEALFETLEENPLFARGEYFHASAYLITKEDIENRLEEFSDTGGGIDGKGLELDKEYDTKVMGKQAGVIDISLNLSSGNTDYESGAEAVKEIKKAFDEAGIGFYYISFGVYNEEGNYAYRVDYFPYEEIDKSDLAKKLKEANNADKKEY